MECDGSWSKSASLFFLILMGTVTTILGVRRGSVFNILRAWYKKKRNWHSIIVPYMMLVPYNYHRNELIIPYY